MVEDIMTRGLRLEFSSDPPLSLQPPDHILPSKSQLPIIRSFIPDLLSRNIIRIISSPQPLFFSRPFTVEKKDGPFRLILDLSLLNNFLLVPHFKMESVLQIASGIVEPLWGCTLDLQDAYFHVPMAWFFHRYLAFVVDGITYVFQYLPFGLSVAPWAFHRVIKPVKAHLHLQSMRVHSYLDDFLFLSRSREGLLALTTHILDMFDRLHIKVNYKKSSLEPSQTVEYLGVILQLDSMTLCIPHSKVLGIITLCDQLMISSFCSRRLLESLVGVLNFASSFLPLGRLRLRPLISWMNSHTFHHTRDLPVPLDRTFKSLLRVWRNVDFLSSSVPMSIPTPTLQLMTDASRSGWSGVLLPHKVVGVWPRLFSDQSSNWLELMAIYLSIQHFLPFLQGEGVLIMSDNTTAVACLLHQGTLRSDSLMCLSQSILEYCLLHSITPVPKHLCGALNVVADQGSRRGVISTEWSLDVRTFQWISSLAGPFQVDLFATRYNTHLPSFVSPFPDPLALDFNALSLQWDVWDSLYLFPPVPLLHQIVPRLCRFKGRGVLIAPYYAQSAWFTPLLLRSPNPVPLPDFHLLSQVTNHGQVFHSNPAVFSLHVWRL